MAGKIQMKRGTYAAMDLNALYQGEWYYCTDTKQIYMAHGDGTGVLIGSGADAAAILAALGVTASATELNYVDGVTAAIQTQLDGKTPVDGWIAAGETWTYASADAPSFVVTVATGAASRYAVGMRIKLTQATVKYFIVTAISDTTLTLYGGTDYTLTASAITFPYYSSAKAPAGFPTDPAKWIVEVVSTTTYNGGAVTANVWKNCNAALAITLPIGAWMLSHRCLINPSNTTTVVWVMRTTLSTANNSESDQGLTTYYMSPSTNDPYGYMVQLPKPVTVAVKTVYYLNVASENNTTIFNVRGAFLSTIIRAVCAYL